MPPSLRLLIVLLATGLATPSFASEYRLPGRVLRVVDGDSLVLDVRGSHYRVDLAAVDAPETGQPWGAAASTFLSRRLTGGFVVATGHAAGTRPAFTATVIHGDRDVGLDLVEQGLAWAIRRPGDPRPPSEDPYQAAEQRARAARRGLWSDSEPIAPWEWRRRLPAAD
jgi:endonuclease YncB( thermonuclease family)